jgi:hypothetical protein
MNYGDLKASVEATLNRSDNSAVLTASFIDKGIRLIQRRARLPFMEQAVIVAVGDDFAGIDIPADFLGLITLHHADHPRPLEAVGRSAFDAVPPGARPQVHTRDRGRLLIAGRPRSGSTLRYSYHADASALGTDEDTNGLLAAMPDLVEWAALIFAAEHFEDPRGDRWNARYEATMADIEAQNARLTLDDAAVAPAAGWAAR